MNGNTRSKNRFLETARYTFDAIITCVIMGGLPVYPESAGITRPMSARRRRPYTVVQIDGGNPQLPLSIGESASRFAWSFQSIRRRSTSDPSSLPGGIYPTDLGMMPAPCKITCTNLRKYSWALLQLVIYMYMYIQTSTLIFYQRKRYI